MWAFYDHHVRHWCHVRANSHHQIRYLADTVACLRRQNLQNFQDHLSVRVYEILRTLSRSFEPIPAPSVYPEVARGHAFGAVHIYSALPDVGLTSIFYDSVSGGKAPDRTPWHSQGAGYGRRRILLPVTWVRT